MAINDFVRRSIQIVGGGIAQSTTDYFDNAISFVNDAKEVIDMGKQMGSDGAKKFNELKSSGILKKTRDWFYNEGGMFGEFDFDDDDFDAGFEIDSADSETSTDSSKPLSKDMMTDIAKKQTGAMYKAFGRQADLHIANTAEIISTINTRTAELTASVNNVNNTLIQIGKRLDLIVEWTAARTKKEEEEKRVAGILDYGGGISLTGVVNKAKENAEDSMLGTFMSIGKTMLGSGMMTPETVMSMILSQTILEKKWDKLGGKSINDIGEFINDTVGEVIQNTMTKVLTSKNDILESLFEDIITRAGGKNYQSSVKNTYNDKPAVFDGMTRKSIITVIPGYLNEILKAVSKDGTGREVDSKGNLVKKTTNSFVKEVADSYFRSGTMEWSRLKAAATRTNLDETEVAHAVRTLTGCWVWYLYRSGRVILEVGEVKDITAASTRSVVDNAAYMMATADSKHRSEDEWKSLYQGIIEQIDEFKYRQELQRSAERADKNLETFARSHVNNHQAKRVDESVILQAFQHNYSDFNRDAKFRNPSEPGSTGATPTAIGSASRAIGITELDYMAGIFDRLNMGLNVFITGQKDNRDHQYKKINMIPGYAARKLRGGGTSSSDDADETSIKPVVNKLKDVLSLSDKKKEKMDDATKEAYEAKERGEELSKEQEKLLKEYEKNSGLLGALKKIPGKIKSGISHFADESRKDYFMDPTVREFSESMSDIFSDIKKKVSDITPDFIKEKFDDAKQSKAGQSVSEGVNTGKNKAKDLMLGHEEMNENGQYVRTGGVLHAVAKPLSAAGTFVGNTSAKFMTTKHLNAKVNDIFDKFKEGGSYAPGGENFNAGSNDYMHIQILSSMADAAMANGEVSTEDKQMMYKEIAAIDDKDVQKRLKQYLIPLMERNSKSKDKTGTGTGEQKSPFGKLGSMLLSAGRLAFGGIFVYVKGVIKTVFGIIKYGLKGIFKLAKWGIMRGLRQIKYGAKSMFEGFKQVFKPLTKGIKHGINIAFKAFNGLKDSLSKGFTSMFSGLSEKLSKWNENRKERKAEKESEGNTTGQRLGRIPQKISDAKSKLIDKIGGNSNGFMGGFFSARNERKAAEAKAKADAESKPMRDAMEQTGIPEIRTAAEDVADVLKDESDSGKGFMKPVLKLLHSILDKKEEESQTGVTSDQKPETPQMESIGSPQGGENGESKERGIQMPEIGGARSTDLGGGSSDAGADSGAAGSDGAEGGSKGGGKGGGLKNGLGKILGGISNMMGGLLNIVISIVMSLEGAKAIFNLVMTILTESLQPLNEAFQALMKAFKPILKQLGGIIKQISEFIVVIVEAVMDVIKPILTDVVQPILEVLSPLLQAILGAITPILKIVSILLKVIMAPLMGLFKFVLLPILKIIGDAVQIIMGVLQIGFGLIMGAVGTIIAAIGTVISAIPGAGGKGKGIKDSGKNMMSQGAEFVASGVKSVAQGAINLALDYASLYTLGATDELLGRNDKEENKETKKIEAPEGNAVEETFASGDVTNIYNTYGGEYQRGMGGYLNMNQRGCGPIALADMYNRNNEGRISARALAGSMYGSGRYDPHRGTSVGDYIDTAHSMGMNLTPGKVTQQTLKSASPTHPITVVGSGSDYGTRRGNNHFMNVIGTDSHGTAFVSNPLTGRIDRKPASTIAGSAVMGLYGSGDEADGGYTFPQAIKDAFQKLKAEAAKVLGLFTMEKSDEEETNDLINEEQNKNATEQAKRQLQANNSELYEKYEAQAKIDARKAYEEKYPKKDGQTDEEYEKGFEDFWNKNSSQYLARAVVEDKTMSEAAKEDFDEKSGYRDIAAVSDKFATDMASAFEEVGSAADSAESSFGSSGGGSGYFTSDEGVPLWVPYGDDIQITETDITKGPANAPLFEFFAKTMGLSLGDIYGSGWFTHYNDPDKEGVGSSGGEHSGVDFTGGSILGKPLYATTGGKVIANWTPGESGGGGNTVVWEDSAGKYHWYMHMNDKSTLNVGDTIEGGTLIGYAGNTGHSTGPHLHYTINDTIASSGSGHVYNPLMYFSNYNPTGGEHGVALGDTDEEKVYSYLTTAGMTPIGASGLMGCFKYESNMQTNNLENSYNDQFGLSDTEYTQAVDSGKETEQQFISGRNATAWSGQTPGEAVGYGIAQFTSSNLKRDLYAKTVKQGGSIAKLEPQLDAIIEVLKQRGIYDTINNAKTPTDANKTFLWKYEAGTGYTSDEAVLRAYPWMKTSNPDGTVLRHQYAEQVYNAYKNWKPQAATHGFTDSNGNVKINSAGDEKMYKNQQQTGSTSGKGTGIVITQSDQLNVRKDKSINSDIIGHLNSGDQIDIEGCNSNEWLYVPSLGGYVSSDFVRIITNDSQNNDWGVKKYEGAINSGSDAKFATEGYSATKSYTFSNTGYSNKTTDHTGDAQWYKTGSGDWKYDDKVFAVNDPRWRSAWYNESAPTHYNEARSAYDALGHMVIVSHNPNLRGGVYYNNLVKGYGGGSIGRDAVESLYNEVGNWEEWKKSRDNYIETKKSKRIKTPFVEDLNALHNAFWPNNKLSLTETNTRVRGSGDADAILAEDQFWNDYLGWNSRYSSNVTRGLSDGSDTAYSNDTYYDTETGTTVVNNYAVTRAEDKATDARLKAILANTYNVRSESMEALLEAILEELRKRRNPRGGGNNTNGSQKLFDERIPAQVTKLSIG